MRLTDRRAFAQLITDVMAFYKQDVSTFALSVWWQVFERFDLEQVQSAFSAHLGNAERGQFAPKPADLIRHLEGTATDRAMLAWGKVLDAMQRVGAYSDVVFDDAIIHACIEDLGGWAKVCRGEMKDLSYLQHRFCEAHRAYAGRGVFDYPRRLGGDNSPSEMYERRGLAAPKPVIVGDIEKARLVYQGGAKGGRIGIAQHVVQAIEHGPVATPPTPNRQAA